MHHGTISIHFLRCLHSNNQISPTMYKGKSTCRELKRIRKMIAEQNNIPLEDSECHYEGDCAGTCPKCDADVRFLENARRKSKQLGKVVTLSG
ncbi:MAG: hypothetical protein J6Y47_08705, partial [Bacteroidales bacterium]|nr:hypothetical protein [Bacteroidales bacterium]